MMDNTLEWQGSSEAETLKRKRVVLSSRSSLEIRAASVERNRDNPRTSSRSKP
jgi:hypothetical protein